MDETRATQDVVYNKAIGCLPLDRFLKDVWGYDEDSRPIHKKSFNDWSEWEKEYQNIEPLIKDYLASQSEPDSHAPLERLLTAVLDIVRKKLGPAIDGIPGLTFIRTGHLPLLGHARRKSDIIAAVPIEQILENLDVEDVPECLLQFFRSTDGDEASPKESDALGNDSAHANVTIIAPDEDAEDAAGVLIIPASTALLHSDPIPHSVDNRYIWVLAIGGPGEVKPKPKVQASKEDLSRNKGDITPRNLSNAIGSLNMRSSINEAELMDVIETPSPGAGSKHSSASGNDSESPTKCSRPTPTKNEKQLIDYLEQSFSHGGNRRYVTGYYFKNYSDFSLWYLDRTCTLKTYDFDLSLPSNWRPFIKFIVGFTCASITSLGYDPLFIPPKDSKIALPLTTKDYSVVLPKGIACDGQGKALDDDLTVTITDNPIFIQHGGLGRGTVVYPISLPTPPVPISTPAPTFAEKAWEAPSSSNISIPSTTSLPVGTGASGSSAAPLTPISSGASRSMVLPGTERSAGVGAPSRAVPADTSVSAGAERSARTKGMAVSAGVERTTRTASASVSGAPSRVVPPITPGTASSAGVASSAGTAPFHIPPGVSFGGSDSRSDFSSGPNPVARPINAPPSIISNENAAPLSNAMDSGPKQVATNKQAFQKPSHSPANSMTSAQGLSESDSSSHISSGSSYLPGSLPTTDSEGKEERKEKRAAERIAARAEVVAKKAAKKAEKAAGKAAKTAKVKAIRQRASMLPSTKPRPTPDYVLKCFWPQPSQQTEADILQMLSKELPDWRDNLPRLLYYVQYSEAKHPHPLPSQVLTAFLSAQKNFVRIPRLQTFMVFAALRPLETFETYDDFWTIFMDVFHSELNLSNSDLYPD